jgi:hypothetical protein
MADIVLDTDGLADFLAQYFGRDNRRSGRFMESDWLSHRAVQEINRIMDFFVLNEWVKDYVIGSTFAFMEIVRKWDDLIQGRIQPYQLRAFLDDPPVWFLTAAVDKTLIQFYCQLPGTVQMPGGNSENIEWTDAVHAATALSRNEPGQPRCRLRTRDTRIARIGLIQNDCI